MFTSYLLYYLSVCFKLLLLQLRKEKKYIYSCCVTHKRPELGLHFIFILKTLSSYLIWMIGLVILCLSHTDIHLQFCVISLNCSFSPKLFHLKRGEQQTGYIGVFFLVDECLHHPSYHMEECILIIRMTIILIMIFIRVATLPFLCVARWLPGPPCVFFYMSLKMWIFGVRQRGGKGRLIPV